MTGGHDVLLAFDFGLRRIGIASGNLLTRTASPLTTLQVRRELPWRDLDQLIEDWRPSLLVVGMPTALRDTDVTSGIREFVTELKTRYGLSVAIVDETLTSHEARSNLTEGRRSGFLRRRVAKGRVDRGAACLIAEQWLNEPSHEE